jgi:hypothetical protein
MTSTTCRGKFRTIVLALVLTGTIAATAYATNSSLTTIDQVRVTGTGVLVISVPSGNNGCGGSQIQVTDAARAQDLRPLALAALLAGRQVTFTGGTCGNSPWTNTLTAADLAMK